jgi:hypothetical protein
MEKYLVGNGRGIMKGTIPAFAWGNRENHENPESA